MCREKVIILRVWGYIGQTGLKEKTLSAPAFADQCVVRWLSMGREDTFGKARDAVTPGEHPVQDLLQSLKTMRALLLRSFR